jgi:hypothetical protein
MARGNNNRNSRKNNKKAKVETKEKAGKITKRYENKIYRNKNEYFGGFKNDKRDGWGMMTYQFPDIIFDKNGKYHDHPTYSNTRVWPYRWVIYSGGWKNSQPHGEGKLLLPDDSYCEGFWNKGSITSGEFRYKDGRVYKGNFAEMHYTDLFHITPFRHGYGTMYRSDGSKKFEGWWHSDPCKFSISSIFPDESQDLNYTGLSEFGIPRGEGTYFPPPPKSANGQWVNGTLELDDKTLIYSDSKIQDIVEVRHHMQ